MDNGHGLRIRATYNEWRDAIRNKHHFNVFLSKRFKRGVRQMFTSLYRTADVLVIKHHVRDNFFRRRTDIDKPDPEGQHDSTYQTADLGTEAKGVLTF